MMDFSESPIILKDTPYMIFFHFRFNNYMVYRKGFLSRYQTCNKDFSNPKIRPFMVSLSLYIFILRSNQKPYYCFNKLKMRELVLLNDSSTHGDYLSVTYP